MSRHPATEYDSHLPAPLYTVDELANRLRVDRATIYRLQLPFVVVGARRRYRAEDVEGYLAARREDLPHECQAPRRGEARGGSGREHSKRTQPRRQSTAAELVAALELRERLAAIVDELELLDADETDVPRVLAQSLLEELDRLLASEAAA